MRSDNWSTRIRKILTPVLLYLIVAVIVEFIFSGVAVMQVVAEHGPEVANNPEYFEYVMQKVLDWALYETGITQLICIPVLLLMYSKDKKKLVAKSKDVPITAYCLLPVIGGSAAIMLNGALLLSGLYQLLAEGYTDSAEAIYSQPVWMVYVVTAIFAPVMEELIFRGLIFKRMRTYSIFSLAALVSSVIFGIYHMNMLQFLYATLLGLILAYSYEKFRTVFAPVIVHGAANAISVLISTDIYVGSFLMGDEKRVTIVTLVCFMLTAIGIVAVDKLTRKQTN